MACFLVPMGEAIAVTIVKSIVEKKEQSTKIEGVYKTDSSNLPQTQIQTQSEIGLTWSQKLSWLNRLLWGGVLLLALEHLWHGEIVPWPPFLTAMNNPADVAPMLHEVATIGTSMAIFVTFIWICMVLIADRKVKNAISIHANA